MMPVRCVWRLCLCLSLMAPSLACNLPLHNFLGQKSLYLLLWMRDSIPLHCVRDSGSTVHMQLDLGKVTGRLQSGDRMQVCLQTLRHLHKLYSHKKLTSSWDPNEILGFRLVLDRQRVEMERCARDLPTPAMDNPTSTIHSHFKELGRFLRHKRFSDCAWEVIRAKTSSDLQQILTLATKESKKRRV